MLNLTWNNKETSTSVVMCPEIFILWRSIELVPGTLGDLKVKALSPSLSLSLPVSLSVRLSVSVSLPEYVLKSA